jgi:single-strand DNA-binding protein
MRGIRIIVAGRLRQRSYETKEGDKRTSYEIDADDVGPSLRNASAKVTKTTRAHGNGGGAESDPWAAGQPAGPDGGEPPF